MMNVIRDLALAGGIGALVIMIAMAWDLAVGVRKAKERGEARTSYGLARTATKMLTYYGAYGIGLCIDVLLQIGGLWEIIGIDRLARVPVIAIVIAVFLCFVELLSIKESADEKTKKKLSVATETLVKMASKSELAQALAEAIKEAIKENKND